MAKTSDNILNDGEPIVMQEVVKQTKQPAKRAVKKSTHVTSLVDTPDKHESEKSGSIRGSAEPVIGGYAISDDPAIKMPEYATENSACFDLFTYLDIDTEIVVYNLRNYKKPRKPLMLRNDDGIMELSFVMNPGDRALIPTGFVFAIPDGYSMRLHPRSGLSLKSYIGLANSEGVIDDDYVDPTYALLSNQSDSQFVIKLGDRLCQGELYKNQQCEFKLIKTKPIKKTSRNGGLGSTGIK